MNLSPQAKHKKWHQELSKWQQSSMSVSAYCRQAGISAWNFHYWRKKLLPPVTAEQTSFVELTLTEAMSPSSGLWIELPGSVRLVIDQDFNDEALLRVVATLGELKC